MASLHGSWNSRSEALDDSDSEAFMGFNPGSTFLEHPRLIHWRLLVVVV